MNQFDIALQRRIAVVERVKRKKPRVMCHELSEWTAETDGRNADND